MADFVYQSLDTSAISKGDWTKKLRKLTLTLQSLRTQVHEMAVGAIAHFVGEGDGNTTRLNDLNDRLHDQTGALLRVWVIAAAGEMLSYDRKEGKYKVRRGWAAQKDTLNEAVLAVNPLDFGKVENDPAVYTPNSVITALQKILKQTQGEVGKNRVIEDSDQPTFEHLQPVIENAIAQAKAIIAAEESDESESEIVQLDSKAA